MIGLYHSCKITPDAKRLMIHLLSRIEALAMQRACRVFICDSKHPTNVSDAVLKIEFHLFNPIDRILVLLIDRNETLALSV